MIKIFRNIRRVLLSENKFSRYLLYAIGEILLVVIGILIALQVNDWYQKQLDRKEEKTILTNLKDDFQKAIEEFNFLNSLRNDIISAAREITAIDVSNLDQYPSQNIDSLFRKSWYGPLYRLS